MKKDPIFYIKDILECIHTIGIYVKGISEKDFERMEEKQDAVIWKIAVIGEATKHIPLTLRKKYPDINWKKMAGMGDVLIHQYDGINIHRVWETVTFFVPPLKIQLQQILKELS